MGLFLNLLVFIKFFEIYVTLYNAGCAFNDLRFRLSHVAHEKRDHITFPGQESEA